MKSKVLPAALSPDTGDLELGLPQADLSLHPSTPPLLAWLSGRLTSSDRVERHYAFLLALLVAAAALFAVIKPHGPIWMWGAPLCSFWALLLIGVTLTNVWAEQRDRASLVEVTRLLQFLLAMLSVLIFYDGSNVVNRHRFAQRGEAMLYDGNLLRMDEFLLGWLFPKGQLALYLDTQPSFGVTTALGRVYAEILQILYISYYFWGNAIGVWLAYQYFYYAVYKKVKGTQKRLQWRRIQMFVSAWVGSFVLNHLINLLFPAMSPRIYIKELYINELRGLWLLGGLRNAVTNAAANTYSAFPSGHCGLSILAAILSWRVGLSKVYTGIVCVTSVLIVLATQVLRYHYVVDFLFSLPVVAFGLWLGGFHDRELYEAQLRSLGLEEHDEEGKPVSGSPQQSSRGVFGSGNGRARGGGFERAPLLGGSDDGSGPSASPEIHEVEMGSIAQPLVLSSQVFGLTRSVSAQSIAQQAAKDEAQGAREI